MDKEKLLSELELYYRKKNPKSAAFFEDALHYQIRGGSHNLRLFQPFPFYDSLCQGSQVKDIDGNTYVDFWQGHFGNVLGHNPPVVLEALNAVFQQGQGLATGFPSVFQKELAQIILGPMDGDSIRFTTSGALATMYAIMLAKSFTQRDWVLKIGGGWHGAQPYALKGISVYKKGLNQVESAGLPSELNKTLIMSEFNNIEDLEEKFKTDGDNIACLIMEPFIGAGGFLFGDKEYIHRARQLTEEYGSLLVFDEVVSGFRFHAGPLFALYGIKPDMVVFGKAIGGGMPVSALAGRRDVLELCDSSAPNEKKVKFEGGTFSAHPAAMLAGSVFLQYLIENEDAVYTKIGRLGAFVRKNIEEIFTRYGFNVKCTGGNESIARNSSVIGVQFLKKELDRLTSPEEIWNPDINDFELREKIFKLAMLKEGFNTFHGYGTISYAHTDQEIQNSLDAVERIAKHWQRYL